MISALLARMGPGFRVEGLALGAPAPRGPPEILTSNAKVSSPQSLMQGPEK